MSAKSPFYTTYVPTIADQDISILSSAYNDTQNPMCHLNEAGSLANIFYSFFMVTLLLASVLGNLMVILAVRMSTPLRNRVTSHFIVSLACSDLLLGISQIPFKISSKLHENQFCFPAPACYILLMSDIFCNVASILNLFLIAIDRFVAIEFPFRYEAILSKRNTKFLILSVWTFSALWSIVGIFPWHSKTTTTGISSIKLRKYCLNDNYYFYAASFLGIYIPVLVSITCIYLKILHVAFSQIQSMENTEVSFPRERLLESTSSADTVGTQTKRKRKFYKELRATKSVAIVYLAFVVCWLPSCVINVIILFDNIFPAIKDKDPKLFLFIYYLFIQILPVTSSMVNPFIYSFSNRTFREACKTVLNKLINSRAPRNNDEYMHSNVRNRRNDCQNGFFTLFRRDKNEAVTLWTTD